MAMVYFLWHSDTNTGITLLYGIAYQAFRTAGTSTLSVGNKFPVTNVTLRVLEMGNVNVSTMYWGGSTQNLRVHVYGRM